MAERSLLVLEPGLLTTVQDLGRPGLMRFGVAPGGALDRAALILGNRLVGNAPGAAALEVTLLGPRLRFDGPAVIAVTGADLSATLGGVALPRWAPVAVAAGDEIAFAPTARRVDGGGARAYLCVAGGVAVPEVMGSRSTDLFGGFGGVAGRALRAGDAVLLGEPSAPAAALLGRRLVGSPPATDYGAPTRVTLGPQAERFTEAGVAAFLGAGYAVANASDRMGMRLTGPAVAHRAGADLISEGIAHGAVQVPGDGQPIMLLAARQTVGGYPKIGTVIGADLDALGQRRPGDPLRFAAVTPEAARAATLAYRAALGDDAVTASPRAWAGTGAAGDDGAREEGAMDGAVEAWSAAAVARLLPELRAAGVTSFQVEVSDGRTTLKLTLRRGADGDLAPSAPCPGDAGDLTAPPAPETATDTDLIRAPLLGVFYRRRAPDQPPLVEVGAPVAAGQPLGLLEVMKTYHEVVAPRAGTIAEFLIEDGAFVEFGQAIARLDP